MRINKFFTDAQIMSRRAADQAIADGRVRINGKKAVFGDQVSEDDVVTLDRVKVEKQIKKPIILIYNKPVGVECTANPSVKNNIIEAVGFPTRLIHVGRLDKDSEGLILLTNIGELNNKLLRAKYAHEKEYIVRTNRPISSDQLAAMRQGIKLKDGLTRPCKIKRLSAKCFNIVLTEGKNRQIRRMVETGGLSVVSLKRIRIVNLKLGTLPIGKYRILSSPECQKFLDSI